MRNLTLFALTLILTVTASAAPADCSAKQLITQHVQWLSASKKNVVRVTAVSNQNNRLVSYAVGELSITGSPFPGTNAPTYLGGTLEQFFSDRKYALGEGGGIQIASHPFSPKTTDKVSMNISSEGSIGLTLKSWGNAVIKLSDVRCAAGVLTGITETAAPRSFYVISLTKDQLAVLK